MRHRSFGIRSYMIFSDIEVDYFQHLLKSRFSLTAGSDNYLKKLRKIPEKSPLIAV